MPKHNGRTHIGAKSERDKEGTYGISRGFRVAMNSKWSRRMRLKKSLHLMGMANLLYIIALDNIMADGELNPKLFSSIEPWGKNVQSEIIRIIGAT